MILILFQQQEIGNFAIRFLWFSVVVLGVMSIYLIGISLLIRQSHARLDKKVTEIKNHIYPLILSYLYENTTKQDVIDGLGKPGFSYIVFEETVYEMLEQLDGAEDEALRELIAHPTLRTYHMEKLSEGDDDDKLKSCIYFSQLKTVDPQIEDELEAILDSENLLLRYSAASALMTSDDVSKRANVLATLANNKNISPMAVLELCYKFQKTDEDRDEEIAWFKRLMKNEVIPEKNLAIIIKAVAELGYIELQDDLLELLKDPARYDISGKLIEAKIYALTVLGDQRVLDVIRDSLADHTNVEVRQACARAIGELYGVEHSDILMKLIEDKEYSVRYAALKALYELDESMAESSILEIEEHFRDDARSILEELDGAA